ncbi:MAG: hypothetical protein AUJ92_10950 [Armatimonadetes bacterium CG2_30_59_28]|nr:MAG: hypothetical protein AUJ92_10950 [Armatimonadetes bacterium CG2_30_59_28]
MQWQCANSLLVDPEGKEKAFSEYLASSPAKDPGAASERVKELLRSGEIGLAEKAVTPWLELANKGNEETSRTALREAVLSFCKRDPDFAGSLVTQTVSLREKDNLFSLSLASELMEIAQQDAQGPLGSSCANRVARAFYQSLEDESTHDALADECAFRIALAIQNGPGYYMGNQKAALSAYKEYLARRPEGKYAKEARLALVNLAAMLSRDKEPNARVYVDVATRAASELVEESAIRRHWLGSAYLGAYQMKELMTRIGETDRATEWKEVIVRVTSGN